MFEVILLVFCLLLVCATFVAFWFAHSPRQTARLPYFLKLTDRLLTLLSALQQYRGMSVAQLSGSHFFGRELRAVEQKITGQFVLLIQDLDEESMQLFPCLQINEIKLLRHHWQSAIQQHQTTTPSEVFQRQTQYIEQVMQWLLRIGKRRLYPILSPLSRYQKRDLHGSKNVLKNYVEHLPALAECIAQIRGLGTRLCVTRVVNELEKQRLLFLLNCAQLFLFNTGITVENTTSNHTKINETVSSLQPSPWRIINQAREEVTCFLKLTETTLISLQSISMAPPVFFSHGNKAVDAVYDWLKLERLRILEIKIEHIW